MLSNAVKFTNRSLTSTVSACETKDKMIELSVRDTGIGISKSLLEKLFKVGTKIGRKGTRGELSTGLGLLPCKEFVEKNNTSLRIIYSPQRSSSFFIPSID